MKLWKFVKELPVSGCSSSQGSGEQPQTKGAHEKVLYWAPLCWDQFSKGTQAICCKSLERICKHLIAHLCTIWAEFEKVSVSFECIFLEYQTHCWRSFRMTWGVGQKSHFAKRWMCASIHPSMACVGVKIPQKAREHLWETAQSFDLWDGYYILQEHYYWAEANSWKIWTQYAQTCPLPPSMDKPQKHPVTQVRAAETSFPSSLPSPCALSAVLFGRMWVAQQNVTESEFISVWFSWDNISNPSLSCLFYWLCISLYWSCRCLLREVWKSSCLIK